MDLDSLKSTLQRHLSDGLVIVVGSGLSCAEGLPGMGELAGHLDAVLPPELVGNDIPLWVQISGELKKIGLEAALLKHAPSATLEAAIVAATVAFISEREQKVLAEVITGFRKLRFNRLAKHLLKPRTGVQIVTTNYDRLIEFACEQSGIGVDTMFLGTYCGVVDERKSRMSFCMEVTMTGRQARLLYRDRANIHKPHGSLDWYQLNGDPIRYSGELPLPRLVITPGLNKFRTGYNRPFDIHREKANAAIQASGRLLVVGYGFNDDHLETHLTPKIRNGTPTVIMAKKLSENAVALAQGYQTVLAMEEYDHQGQIGTRVISGTDISFFPASLLWDVGGLVTEALEP